jgi:hypothetical protein
MKKLAILIVLALQLAVSGCGSSNNTSTETNTSTTGNWEAQLIGGTQQASQINFVVAFSVTNSGPLDITGFSFINAGSCFANGVNGSTETGNANFTTASTGAVTGTLNLTVNSTTPAGNSLTLTGDLTGTSSATAGTAGTLSNGIVIGTWMLTGGQGDPSCTGSGTFVMCQGKNTCSTT